MLKLVKLLISWLTTKSLSFLAQIYLWATKESSNENKLEDKTSIVLSCYGTTIPDFGSFSGVSIQFLLERNRDLELVRPCAGKDYTIAYYNAIYEGLTSLANLKNNLSNQTIEIHSDNNIVIREINGLDECPIKMRNKKQAIIELIQNLKADVYFKLKVNTPGILRVRQIVNEEAQRQSRKLKSLIKT